MNAKELKRAIKEEKLNSDFLVLLYQDNTYVADGYIDEICSTKGLEKRVVKSVYDSKNATNALLSNISENLYVVYTDTFSERSEDYSIFENVIVVCKKVEATVKEYISDMMVTLPKLSEWNIKDYISLVYCKGLKQQEVDWLYNVTQGNIYKMKSEVDKLKLFSPDQYTNILLQLKELPGTHLYFETTFAFVDAIVANNIIKLNEILAHRDCCDLTAMFVMTLLFNKYKKILLARTVGMTAEQAGMSPKEFGFYGRNYGSIPMQEIEYRLDVLSSIDRKLKNGELEFSNDNYFLDYIITKLFIV